MDSPCRVSVIDGEVEITTTGDETAAGGSGLMVEFAPGAPRPLGHVAVIDQRAVRGDHCAQRPPVVTDLPRRVATFARPFL